MVQVLVAHDTIPRGKLITDAMLTTRDIPAAYLDGRVIRASEKDKILNLPATSTVPVQQSLAWSDVMLPKDDQRSLSTLVQPGHRAAPLRVQITDALTLVHPGDFVDILCVCGESKEASVLLQRVLVLASGRYTTMTQAKDSERVTILTVSVSLQESQLLALAVQRGVLTAVVRNAQDQRVTEAPADVTMSDLDDPARRPLLQNARRRAGNAPTALKETTVR